MDLTKINWTTVLLIGIIGFLFYKEYAKPAPAKPDVVVNPSGPVVGDKAKAAAAGLAGFPKQAAAMSAFYRDFAKVLRAGDKPKTTGQFRDAHSGALTIFVAADEYKGAPLVGDKIDAAISEAAGGLEDTDLTGTKRAAVIARLEELSAAFAAVK